MLMKLYLHQTFFVPNYRTLYFDILDFRVTSIVILRKIQLVTEVHLVVMSCYVDIREVIGWES